MSLDCPVPEIIDDGLTGFVVDADEVIAAVGRIRNLDRQNVRKRFEQRFTARRMADDYIRLYEGLLHKFQAPLRFNQAWPAKFKGHPARSQ